ncbi:hypothetical protein H0H93_012302, partial [Arthromyces matolae]
MGIYKPKSFTDKHEMRAILLWRLGGTDILSPHGTLLVAAPLSADDIDKSLETISGAVIHDVAPINDRSEIEDNMVEQYAEEELNSNLTSTPHTTPAFTHFLLVGEEKIHKSRMLAAQ